MTAAAAPAPAPRRRWWAAEVVQTSAMDCGPAALKSVLDGFHIRASYGRLREACQTDVDGTSIDTLEEVAPQLGVAAEQVLIPIDHVCLPEAQALPAIAVVRLPDGPAHFVVLWRRLGPWLQVMDPATGRRWVRSSRLQQELYMHEQSVAAEAWRAWAASDEGVRPLTRQMTDLGATAAQAQALLAQAAADLSWLGYGALDACTRMAGSLVSSGGITRGAAAVALLQALFSRCHASPDDIHAVAPAHYWSVTPDPHSVTLGSLHLRLRGAVLVRMRGAVAASPAAVMDAPARSLSPELAAALSERPAHPLAHVWRLLWQDGLLQPLALAAAMVLAAAVMVLEVLLLRGAITIAGQLGSAPQRLLALLALVSFAALLLALEWPIVRESLRHGRRLELRLRMALLARLPHLTDRYFHSRSVGDMAERGHLLQLSRLLPSLGLNFVQSTAELMFTLLGVAVIAPASLPWALAIALVAFALPLLVQPLMAERDLRLRNHSSALHAFCLDALQGAVPARTHGAGPALQRQHEALLVQWLRASRRLLQAGLAAGGVQSLLCSALAAALLVQHFSRSGAVAGADLLLVYWAIKLGAIGQGLAGLAMQYPAQRNVLMRLLEPLSAPVDAALQAALDHPPASPIVHTGTGPAASVHIQQGVVVAAGQTILQDLNLHLRPGEHVAIVGPSGAGKSTLLALLLGWHRLAAGELHVDGQPLDAVALLALRRHTAWVEPGVQLWNRSLIDNLSYASGEQALPRLGAAMAAARLREVLEKLPDGLQTRLGEGGALLSGGEGQRVRLARAFMQDQVRLVLLDEPFRGLDRDQRAQMLADARRWWQAATLLCVTHDVGDTLGFDRVLVVDNGRIVEDGAPQTLAHGHSHYAALLRAEQLVHAELWQGTQWRRLQVRDGVVVEAASAPTPALRPATALPVAEVAQPPALRS
jgi:ABC-type bacteriocin/lantibiotic exporter with double-glycine peptidase domain